MNQIKEGLAKVKLIEAVRLSDWSSLIKLWTDCCSHQDKLCWKPAIILITDIYARGQLVGYYLVKKKSVGESI